MDIFLLLLGTTIVAGKPVANIPAKISPPGFSMNSPTLFGSVKVAESELIRAGIDPTSRGEALGINEFIKIAKVI